MKRMLAGRTKIRSAKIGESSRIAPRHTDVTTYPSARRVVDLESSESWPSSLLGYLAAHHHVFLNWATGAVAIDAAIYDRAIYGLMDALQDFAIIGWHCTRLTDGEIEAISLEGMHLPNATMLARRVDAAIDAGLLAADIGELFKAKNQAHEPNRAGKIWFCFFPPHIAGEGGVGDLFRFWGGEGLYNSHDRDPQTCAILKALGTPSIVEAEIPVAYLSIAGGLPFKVARRYLISRGYDTSETCDHEDRVETPLPPSCIRRVIRFPDPDCLDLSGCITWFDQLTILGLQSTSGGRHGGA